MLFVSTQYLVHKIPELAKSPCHDLLGVRVIDQAAAQPKVLVPLIRPQIESGAVRVIQYRQRELRVRALGNVPLG